MVGLRVSAAMLRKIDKFADALSQNRTNTLRFLLAAGIEANFISCVVAVGAGWRIVLCGQRWPTRKPKPPSGRQSVPPTQIRSRLKLKPSALANMRTR